ncbi:hypothetical protein FA15DRAFT_742803 [Coprinopsis marcescibilis]|uniref:Uncharacterized protein n=1 Tax=Coprinopsis marcescibilis TaxID=230819 RepID=A0A5C3KUL1_COPMA|nr:hypothetical protein FA15DRAFT_742803 [Coprinopsis marcescibilis]
MPTRTPGHRPQLLGLLRSSQFSTMATTKLYLLKYGLTPGPLFPDHWILFIFKSGDTSIITSTLLKPYPTQTCIGDVYHVHGDSATGFAFEVKRNYNLGQAETGPKRIYYIGDVLASSLTGTDIEVKDDCMDPEPKNLFEHTLIKAPIPGPSLQSVAVVSSDRPKTRVKLKNCQSWLIEAIDEAVQAGILTLTANAAFILGRPE